MNDTQFYTLNDNHEVLPCMDEEYWGKWLDESKHERIVGESILAKGEVQVRTIFTGVAMYPNTKNDTKHFFVTVLYTRQKGFALGEHTVETWKADTLDMAITWQEAKRCHDICTQGIISRN